jgi:hypothetical protein
MNTMHVQGSSEYDPLRQLIAGDLVRTLKRIYCRGKYARSGNQFEGFINKET